MTQLQAKTIIESNSRLFREGTTFSQTDLCRIADIALPVFGGVGALAITRKAQKFQLQKTSAYCSLNKILRTEGRVIKQRGTNYYVTTLPEAETVIASYTRRASSITRNKAILTQGVQSHLTFTGVAE